MKKITKITEYLPFRTPMKKRGSFEHKKAGFAKNVRPFKHRRQAIKNGEYSSKALFGSCGCSSFYD